ncbi:MAG: sensor histidine kinase [Syntrophobacteraceae bacterium]
MKRVSNSLAFRLFFLILLVSAVVFISLAFFIIRANRQHVMQEIILSARNTNEVLVRSMRQSMLLNRLEDVAHTIDALSSAPGVEAISIYDKKGSIIFSTNPQEIGQKANVKSEQCIVCHSGEKPLEVIPEDVRSRIFTSDKGYRVLGTLKSVRNEPSCAAPSCHPSPSEQKILGVLDSHFSLEEVDRNTLSSRNLMIIYLLGAILVIELFAGLFILRLVHGRMVKLAEGSRELKRGNLDFSIPVKGNDELADLARSFNSMIASLKLAEDETELSRRMVQTAKMASIGRLATGIAHEINNPLAGILIFADILMREFASINPESSKDIQEIINQTMRCKEIVTRLLEFSRQSVDQKFDYDINSVVERSAEVLRHQAIFHNIEFAFDFQPDIPMMTGDPGQLQQVFINLLMNAAWAMNDRGKISVTSRFEPISEQVILEFTDSGPGISTEVISKVFEPFFTTKAPGEGTGLGLSIAYGIVRRHGGTISVRNNPGGGAVFTVTLPLKCPEKAIESEFSLES